MIVFPPVRERSFASLQVGDVMRHTVLQKTCSTPVRAAIVDFIKYKADALLVVDENRLAVGVVTKTEVLSCYYSELPIDTPLTAVMGAPVISCPVDESLQNALLTMHDRHIHRIYALDQNTGRPLGTLAYPDIVGVLYRYCCRCELSLHKRKADSCEQAGGRLRAKDVMHHSVISALAGASVEAIIELLASYRIGALLLVDDRGRPVGVLSKTNLVLAYRRGVPLSARAESIMRRQVLYCRESTELEHALRQMIFAEVSRIFVIADDSEEVVGIVTLTDAARARSGSCRACGNSRIIPKE
ncbi:MAG: CBS domain-containing protein [Desulfopila sp.]